MDGMGASPDLRMRRIFEAQRAAHLKAGPPSVEKRKAWLDRCISLLVVHKNEIVEALNADFGARSKEMSELTDIAASIGPLKHARDNLARWVRPERRKVDPAPLALFGAKAEVRFQPKGVVGIIAPWNFPVNLT